MKYILLTLAALLLCLAAGWFLASLIAVHRRQHGKPPMRMRRQVLLGLAISLCLILVAALAYLLPYAHAEDSALTAMESTSNVRITKASSGYYFDGPGEEAAILFAPGAKVDARAYAPLLVRLAEGGADCYLYDAPFHMAFSIEGAANEAFAAYPHAHWYVAGHSLGGVSAAGYAVSHPDTVSGIILLAAYPTSKVPQDLPVCSIYGSRDTKLDQDVYASHRSDFPAAFTEVIIDGGNHAQFGDYGPQKGDSKAAISPEEQQYQTAAAILAFLGL